MATTFRSLELIKDRDPRFTKKSQTQSGRDTIFSSTTAIRNLANFEVSTVKPGQFSMA